MGVAFGQEVPMTRSVGLWMQTQVSTLVQKVVLVPPNQVTCTIVGANPHVAG